MTKRFKKIVYTSFLLVFLLGYIGTIVPGSVIASLFDLEVYAEGEPELISSIELENSNIPQSINSNEMITSDWENGESFELNDKYQVNMAWWDDDNGEQINTSSSLMNSNVLYGTIDVMVTDDELYAFDENITVDDITFNGLPVYDIEYQYEGQIYVKIAVPVINNSGPTNVDTITINSATLEYIAGENPQFTATSAQSSQYNVENEKFENINTGAFLYNPANSSLNTGNLITVFEGGETYSYEIKVTPISSMVSLTNAETFTIGNFTYDLVFDGNNANAELDNGSIIFRGVPNIVIAGATPPQPTTYTLTFYTNGGNTIDPLTNINENTVINLSSYNPTRQNYDFDGWYSDPELQNRVTSVTMTENITIYAKWTLVRGNISLTYNTPEGLGAFSINDSTITGNSVTGYITSNYTNTFKISPAYLEGWTVTSVVVTDANSSVTNAGPGTVNADLEFQVNGSTSYDIVITLTKETAPAQTYNVTYNLSGLVSSNTATEITNEENYTTTLSVDPNLELNGAIRYDLPSNVRVLIGEVEYNQVNYNSQNGQLTIPRVVITDDITIIAPAIAVVAKPTASVTEFTYDGGVKSLVVTGFYENLMEMDGYTVATDAGDYSATYNLSSATSKWADGTTDDVVINWTINKAVNTVNITLDDWVYGNTPSTPNVTGILGNASYTLAYKVKGANDSTYTETIPTEVGEYTVKVTTVATQNYTSVSDTDDFEILAPEITKVAKPTASVTTFTYDGEEKTLAVTGYNPEYMNYTGNLTATNAGNYKVTYTLKPYTTWNDDTTDDVELNWTINKAENNITVTIQGWTAGNESHDPVVTGNYENALVTVEYKVKDADDSTYTEAIPTVAGEYTVRVTIPATDNYLGGSATADFEIAAAVNPQPTLSLRMLNYNSYENGIFTFTFGTAYVNVNGTKYTGEVNNGYMTIPGTSAEIEVVVTPNDGVTAEVTIGTTNDNVATIDEDTFIDIMFNPIDEVSVPKPNAEIKTFTYDGEEKTLVVTAFDENAMIMTGNIKGTDAGSYSVTYSLKENYVWEDDTKDPVIINWTIEKAQNNLSVSINNWEFGSVPNTPVITGNHENAEALIRYKAKDAEDTTYTDTVPTQVGEYTVKVVVPETTNYLGGVATADFEITEHTSAKHAKPVAGMAEFTYDGEEKMLVVTGVDETAVVVTGDVKATNAGEYSVTYTLKNEFDTWDDDTTEAITFDWKINKAELNSLAVRLDGWLFGEEPNEPVVTGNLGNAPYTIQYKSRAIAGSTYSDEVPTEIGSYRVKVEVEESQNYLGNVATSNFEISSNIIHVDMPQLVNKSYLYTGEPITVEALYSEDKVNATGLTYTEIGTYQARFTLKQENFVWGDETREDKVIEWKIVSGAPEVKTSYTYNSTKLTITEDPSVTGFQIKECNSKGESCKELYKGNKLSYTHTKRKFNTTYYYKVRSYTTVDGTTTYGPYTDLLSIKATLNAPKLKASKNRYQEVKLTWNKEDGASKYYLYRCNEDGSGCKNIKTLTGTKYYDKSGKEGVTYQYKVRAYRLSKYSKYSSLTEGLKLNDDLTVKVKNSAYLTNTINIKYKEGATKYEVYKSTNNRTWKLIKTINVTDSTVITDEGINVTDKKDLSFNKKVYYRVRANNGVNNTSYTTKNVTTSFVNAVTVNATTNRYQEVKLTWDKSTGAEKYYVYTCDEDGNNCKELATTKSNSYTDKKAKEGKSTFYKVRAYKAKKYSKYSNLAQGFRVNDNLSVTLENNNYKEVTVRVQKLSGAYKYYIERSTDNKTWKALDSFTYDGNENVPEEIMYVDTSAPYNKKVYYRVRANNGVNYTAWTTKNITTSKKAE